MLRISLFILSFALLLVNCGPCDKISLDVSGTTKTFSLSEISEKSWLVTANQNSYRFAICKNIDFDCTSTESTGGRCRGGGSSGSCKSWSSDRSRMCFGTSSQSTYEALGTEGIKVTYHGGDDCATCGQKEQFTEFHILCDPKKKTLVEGDFRVIDDGRENITIEFKHSAGCPINSGLSIGSIMLIIIFVTFAVYLIVGIAINVGIRKMSGIEIVPNWSFWRGCPSLVVDGILFVVNKIRGTSGTYTRM